MRALLVLLVVVAAASAADPTPIIIETRRVVPETRTQTVTRDGQQVTEIVTVLVPILQKQTVEPSRSAVVICDMWDDHWCASAAKRCDVLAKNAAPVVTAARAAGMTILHCPSDCMAFYKDHPARARALAVASVDLPKTKDLPNPPLPIDDSDGGCDDGKTPFRKAWTRQHPAITIADADYITDDGKNAFAILQSKKITTVFVMGVHTNMCVLNRGFAIKQLTRWGLDCILVRDLTDAMYNPKMKPFVTHDEGTGLVIQYIEQNWCPSTTSVALKVSDK